MIDKSKQTAETPPKDASSTIIVQVSLYVAVVVPIFALFSMVLGHWCMTFLAASVVLFCNTGLAIANATKFANRTFTGWVRVITALASFVLACAALVFAGLAREYKG
jgi:hypothetical protein